jgi:hypothetical protein
MKSHKKNLELIIRDVIYDNHFEISDQDRYKIAKLVSEEVMKYNSDKYKEFHGFHQELALKYEQNRAFISSFMRMIQKNSEDLIADYKQKHFAKLELDNKTRKPILVYKTSVLKETCDFMNSLNKMVVEYNSKVMLKETEENQREQVKLF